MLLIHQCKDCKISSILKIYFDYFVLIGSLAFVLFCDIPDLLTTFAIKTINYEYGFFL